MPNFYLKRYLRLTVACLLTSVLPLVWILILFPIKLLAIFIARRNEEYGKFLGFCDGLFDEDFVNKIPRSIIVTLVELKGDLTLEELRKLFQEQVLDNKARYPEFQQYITSIFGYRVWKDDPYFSIENHIREEIYNSGDAINDNINENINESLTLLDLGNLTERLINERMVKHRSPWEIILVRNVIPVDGQIESECEYEIGSGNENLPSPKTVIALRLHHDMGDAKSILKVIVECLGQKDLEMAIPSPVKEKSIKFYLALPLYFLWNAIHTCYLTFRHHTHAWKCDLDDESKMVVKFSKSLSLRDVKLVGKMNQVPSSAVIMAIITGAIRRLDERLGKCEIFTGYILPKKKHPYYLTNHMYGALTRIPTDEDCTLIRLRKCNDAFNKMKHPAHGLCNEVVYKQVGSLPFPLKNFLGINYCTSIWITNIAGERDEFSIGDGICTGFRMCVGPIPGYGGAVFSVFSYKESFRIAVGGKESILKSEDAAHLAHLMEIELDALLRL